MIKPKGEPNYCALETGCFILATVMYVPFLKVSWESACRGNCIHQLNQTEYFDVGKSLRMERVIMVRSSLMI